MLILRCKVHHLGHFGLGDFIREDATHADAFLVDMQHHAGRLIGVHLEKRLQHMDDEFHWRVIVIEQQNFVEAGLLRLWARARGEADARASPASATFVVAFINHGNLHYAKIGQGRG